VRLDPLAARVPASVLAASAVSAFAAFQRTTASGTKLSGS